MNAPITKPVPEPDRADDECLLAMMAMRHNGLPLREIGFRLGVSHNAVATRTNAVRQADLAESGEPPRTVDRAYWRAGSRS